MEFKKFKLSELGEIVGGSTPSTKIAENYGGTISWITPKDLANYNKMFIKNGERNITEQGFKSCSAKMLPKNSILFTSRAPIGYIAIADKELCTNQGFKSIIPNSNVDYLFLYYLLKYNKEYIASFGSGTTFKEVSGTVMKNIEVMIPESIEDQRKISNILYTIDKKIELNNQTNDNLLNLIQSLYIEKIKNNNDDRFEEKTLDEFCNIFTGKKNANASVDNGQYKFFTCAPEPLNINSYIYDGPAIIVAGNGAYTGRTTFYNGKFDLYQRTYGITSLDDNNYIYLLYAMVYTDLQNDIMGGTHGSAIPYIVFNDIAKFKVKYNKSIFNTLSNQIKSLLIKIKSNEFENESLIQLRDTLIPKLMNGEIDLDKTEIESYKL